MEGIGPFAQLPPTAARKQLSKKPTHPYGTSTEALSTQAPAVPPYTGHNLVQNKKNRQTDIPRPPSLPLGSCHCSNTKVFIRQPAPASSASPQQARQGAAAT